MSTRRAYKWLSILGDLKALSRGPDDFAKRQVRKTGHRLLAKLFRKSKVLRP